MILLVEGRPLGSERVKVRHKLVISENMDIFTVEDMENTPLQFRM